MSEETPSRAGRRLTDPVISGTSAPQPAPERAEPAAGSNLPISAVELQPKVDAPFEAQRLAQGGEKRGLRGGQPVLDHARAAYLETEWSGPADRRPPKGIFIRGKI